ncbi:hypothetical protein BES08_29115 (plasmid) [Novosphingobium resinovorum]|uniref:Uncharacterized protein n=1 Tax=Novosphingobium resinovorum TaxID=158500 RepID=A0A1D8AFI2_9SPHN|nr:hypothetical protein BES08_29115 [Novosphingobium resinovorum]
MILRYKLFSSTSDWAPTLEKHSTMWNVPPLLQQGDARELVLSAKALPAKPKAAMLTSVRASDLRILRSYQTIPMTAIRHVGQSSDRQTWGVSGQAAILSERRAPDGRL